jgi:dipeptide/tripeptide permease
MAPMNPGSITESEHATTPAIWAGVAVVIAGSIVAGIALIEWWWPVFWVGIAMMVLGSGGLWKANVMDAVSEWTPTDSPQRQE